ncbi:hypothetical protein GGR55DRAFT_187173 [Xylaria sp. FL0064]|nr:hypothetical protein GGR55DRAFT_187173 [Xylaria sp. FL0064]
MNSNPHHTGHKRPWNFWPLTETPPLNIDFDRYLEYHNTNMIEYNLGLGSRTSAEAKLWIDLACLFMIATLNNHRPWLEGEVPPPLAIEEFKMFILAEADKTAMTEIEKRTLKMLPRWGDIIVERAWATAHEQAEGEIPGSSKPPLEEYTNKSR